MPIVIASGATGVTTTENSGYLGKMLDAAQAVFSPLASQPSGITIPEARALCVLIAAVGFIGGGMITRSRITKNVQSGKGVGKALLGFVC